MIIFFRNDPINDFLYKKFEEVNNKKFSFEQLQNFVNKSRSVDDFLQSLVFSHQMLFDYKDNARSWLNFFDDLMQIGYYYDAEKIIEKKYNEKESLYLHKPHPLIVERYYDILIAQYDFEKAFEVVFSNLDVLDNNKRLINKLERDLLFTRNSHGLDLIFKNGFIEKEYIFDDIEDDVLNKFNRSIIDGDGIESIKYSWLVLSKGEHNLIFFKNATKLFSGENISSRRYIYFVVQAYKLYPDDLGFLVLFCKTQMFLGFYEKIKFLLDYLNIKSILTNPNVSQNIRSDLYYIYLKISAWTGYEDDVLINHNEALRFDLMMPFTLNLINQGALLISNDKPLTEKIINAAEINVDSKKIHKIWSLLRSLKSVGKSSVSKSMLLLSGQIRGSIEAKNIVEKYISVINPDYLSVNTWELQNVRPPRLGRIDRYFSKEILALIPNEELNYLNIKNKFPNLIKKIESLNKLKISYKDFSYASFNFIKIESEEDFEIKLRERPGNFKIRGTYNQSKMIYKICDVNNFKIHDNDAIVRSRLDINPVFGVKLKDYINTVKEANNYIYTNYFGPAGSMGDQFWIAGGLAFKKMSKLWSLSCEFENLVYLDSFDEYAKSNAAEDLCMAHAIALAIDLRFIKSKSTNNFISPDLSKYCSLDESVKNDYFNLDDLSKEKFLKFYGNFLN